MALVLRLKMSTDVDESLSERVFGLQLDLVDLRERSGVQACCVTLAVGHWLMMKYWTVRIILRSMP